MYLARQSDLFTKANDGYEPRQNVHLLIGEQVNHPMTHNKTITKKAEMEIEVCKMHGEWKVLFGFGNQTFELKYGGTKAEATWMAQMLKKCFANYTKAYKV